MFIYETNTMNCRLIEHEQEMNIIASYNFEYTEYSSI